jgi:uncharacterized protein
LSAQLLVLAKAPVPGRVKTRLCPPWTPAEAAELAAAALADTLVAVCATPAVRRTLVVDGDLAEAPAGVAVVPQRGHDLGDRLAAAFVDTAVPGVATVLVGMDTPQLTPSTLAGVVRRLVAPEVDAVLGPAYDGGWWVLGLRDPAVGAALAGVVMSTPWTAAHTRRGLEAAGLHVVDAPRLRDVDTAADAAAVRALAPGTRFAQVLDRLTASGYPAGVGR